MEFRCRCHGLSGSCSLKTCWLSLPNFQIIGAYLKRKYDASVHLPTAVGDVNKLIPMMNRDEISAILNNQLTMTTNDPSLQQTSPNSPEGQITTSSFSTETPNSSNVQMGEEPTAVMQPEYAALVSSGSHSANQEKHPVATQPSSSSSSQRLPLSGHFIMNTPPSAASQNNLSTPINLPTSTQHYNYYERHKQLQLATEQSAQNRQQYHINLSNQTAHQIEMDGSETNSSNSSNEIPVNITPLSQQQYLALLRDMRLCNTTTATTTLASAATGNQPTVSYLTTRDLQNQQQQHLPSITNSKRQISKSKLHNNQAASSGQSVKSANQHLSQILQNSNKDELIYLHKSPNYCEADLRHGFPGIQSRICSDNPLAPNNCDKLCCGRGYTTRIYPHSYRCDCKFQYCCRIQCSVCEDETKVLVCN